MNACVPHSPAHNLPVWASLLLLAALVACGLPGTAKPQLPANVSLELAPGATAEKPFVMTVTANLQAAVADGTLTVTLPAIGTAPAQQTVLWTGEATQPTVITKQMTVPALPAGLYQLSATLLFTLPGAPPQQCGVTGTLYLKAGATRIATSTISLAQVLRDEIQAAQQKGMSTAEATAQLEALNRIEALENAPAPANDTTGKAAVSTAAPAQGEAKLAAEKVAPQEGTKTGTPSTTNETAAKPTAAAPVTGEKAGTAGAAAAPAEKTAAAEKSAAAEQAPAEGEKTGTKGPSENGETK